MTPYYQEELMHPQLEKIRQDFKENPIGIAAGFAIVATSCAKVVDTLASARSKNAYAKSEKLRQKRLKK